MDSVLKIPTKLSEDLILEAVLGVRFLTKLPAEVVYGHVYQAVAAVFPDVVVENLPILQIPEDIRKADINLRYQPYWRLAVGNYDVWVGHRVINLSVRKPYVGWVAWRGFMMKLLPDFQELLHGIEQISLRYINFTEQNLCDVTNLNVEIGLKGISCQPMVLQTESSEGDLTKALRLTNNAVVNIQGELTRNGSLIDVEIGKNVQFSKDFFKNQFGKILEELHDAEKESFFEILQTDFLESLKPEYGDE